MRTLAPDDDARAHIAKAALALRVAVDARPVPQENYHTTLAFVGEVSMPQLAVLQQIGRAQRAAACTIRFDAYDYWRDPQVVVAVALDDEAEGQWSAEKDGERIEGLAQRVTGDSCAA